MSTQSIRPEVPEAVREYLSRIRASLSNENTNEMSEQDTPSVNNDEPVLLEPVSQHAETESESTTEEINVDELLSTLDLDYEEVVDTPEENTVEDIVNSAMSEENNTDETLQEEVNEEVEELNNTDLDQLVDKAMLKPNSDSILVSEETSRFSGAIWYEKIQQKSITLAGVGGIGSYVGFLLARMHPHQITIFDDDTVEEVNLSGQFFGSNHIGLPKVDALFNNMRMFSNYHDTIAYAVKYTESEPASDIMICGFDNMEARKIFFRNWVAHVFDLGEEFKKNCLFIDGRLAAEELQVFAIRGDDTHSIARYNNNYLFSDDEAEEAVCSYKQTSFMANMIGSIIVNLFVNFVANECNPIIDRDLPFYTTYKAETMYFKTET